jgi:hypothetical protein
MVLVKHLNISHRTGFEITASRIQRFLIGGHVKDVQFYNVALTSAGAAAPVAEV